MVQSRDETPQTAQTCRWWFSVDLRPCTSWEQAIRCRGWASSGTRPRAASLWCAGRSWLADAWTWGRAPAATRWGQTASTARSPSTPGSKSTAMGTTDYSRAARKHTIPVPAENILPTQLVWMSIPRLMISIISPTTAKYRSWWIILHRHGNGIRKKLLMEFVLPLDALQ